MAKPEATPGGEEGQGESEREASLLVTLADRGEEAMRRMREELESLSGKPRVQEARERLDKVSHSILTQLHIASREEIEELRAEVATLEARVAVLEKALARAGQSPSEGGQP